MKIEVKKLSSNAILPTYGTEFSAGADLYCCEEGLTTILPNETKFIHTKISVAIPNGYVGLIYARSGLSTKRGLAPANKVGVIDSDYRGEIIVALYNQSSIPQQVEVGERIAQMVITPYYQAEFVECDTLSETVRGQNGFGSTGNK